MASALVEIKFPEQIKVARKSVQDSFKKSHEALRVRESNLLSRVDEIEKEYNSKTQEMKELLESLNNIKSISSNTLKSNKLSDTQDAVTTLINNKIAEVTADIHNSIKFEWDILFETNIKQLGSIKLNGQTTNRTVPNIPLFSSDSTHDSTGQKMELFQFKGSSQPPTQFTPSNSSGISQSSSQPDKLSSPIFPTNQGQAHNLFTPQGKQTTSLFPQQQQQQQSSSNFGIQTPVIPGPSMFNAEPTNLSTNLFNKQTNVFSPNQKSTFTFSATGNTPQTSTAPFAFAGTPLPNQQKDVSLFNMRNKTIPYNFQFDNISKTGTVRQSTINSQLNHFTLGGPTEPAKEPSLKQKPTTPARTAPQMPIPQISLTGSNNNNTATNVKPVIWPRRSERVINTVLPPK